MTDVREKLANHLTAHGVPLELGIRSTSIEDMLAGMDWAMLLGLIEPRQAAMLLAKYCGDLQEERKCRVWWRAEVEDYGRARGWKLGGMVDRMAEATMSEHLGHHTRCAVCNGTREQMVNKLPVVCPCCDGAGFLPYSPYEFTVCIGITALEWDRQWRDRVGWARRALYRWEVDAAEALLRRHG